jgi:hypothetical protein
MEPAGGRRRLLTVIEAHQAPTLSRQPQKYHSTQMTGTAGGEMKMLSSWHTGDSTTLAFLSPRPPVAAAVADR